MTTMIAFHRLGGTAPNRSPSQVTAPAPTHTHTHPDAHTGQVCDCGSNHQHQCLCDAAENRRKNQPKICDRLSRSGFGEDVFLNLQQIVQILKEDGVVFYIQEVQILWVVFFSATLWLKPEQELCLLQIHLEISLFPT